MPFHSDKVELLAPAGNFEKLRIAVEYGADAVYLADKRFSLRNAADNFTVDQIDQAVAYARQNHVKIYVACNIYPRTAEEEQIAQYFEELGRIRPDAVIVADPGILMMARTILPDMAIHLSTQANTTSLKTVQFWERQGVSRINIARELSLAEIREITTACNVEIEAFVHGAVCISYSGRCLLSNFLSSRDSNRGVCSHPCRWRYYLSEAQRPGLYMPMEETDRGTFIFNSKDLCMIEHLDKMIKAGIASLKIEGRMKSVHYLAVTVHTYREAIDAYYRSPDDFRIEKRWKKALTSVTSRGYTTNFYFGYPDQDAINYNATGLKSEYAFIGKVLQPAGPGWCLVQVKNKLFNHDPVEILSPGQPSRNDKILEVVDDDGRQLEFAQPNSIVKIKLNGNCLSNDMIRRIEK